MATRKTVHSALASTRRPVPMRGITNVVAGDGLENFVAGLGNHRDKRHYASYHTPKVLSRYELENMYRCSWLSKRIVNAVADDMTREWRRPIFGDDDTNPNIEKFQDTEKQYQVSHRVNEALRWGRLYGGCLLIIGTNDTNDLSKPLNLNTLRKGCLKWIHVVDRWRVSPNGQLNKDLTSMNFGLPEAYLLAESSVEVHHTRVLRFDGEKLPYFAWLQNAMWDDSVLQHAYDSIQDFDTICAAVATMIYEANVDVIKTPDLTELLSTKGGEQKLTRRFQAAMMMKSFNRTLLLDSGEEYDKKQNTFTNLADIWNQSAVNVCGSEHIPMVVLFGQSAAGLNATGDTDLRNYYDMIKAKQITELKSRLEYLDEILLRHTFGNVPADYSFEFESLWQMSDDDQASIDYQNAQRDQIYLNAGVVTEGLVASELKARGTYQSMSNDDVELAEELSEFNQEQREAQAQGGEEEGDGAVVAGKNQEPDNAVGTADPDKSVTPSGRPKNNKAQIAVELNVKTRGEK